MTTLDWLLDSDPAIRHQVLRDLVDAPPDEVRAERSRVAREGWGARLLSLQDPEGTWDHGTYRPGWVDESRPFFSAWTATHFSVTQLRDFGVDPDDPLVRAAMERVAANVRWDEVDGGELYFHSTTEACVAGVLLSNIVYFGFDASIALEGVLADQQPDGGWNCEKNTPVSSFHSTICVIEGLLAWEAAADPADPRLATVREARMRGEEYLLARRLMRRLSTGGIIDPRFTMTTFPTRWHYDVLRALEHFRRARPGGDDRLLEAVELVRGKADAVGRFPLENELEGPTWFSMDECEGAPSRWVTLSASRVLRWWDGLTPR
jgi:hypothetical protein